VHVLCFRPFEIKMVFNLSSDVDSKFFVLHVFQRNWGGAVFFFYFGEKTGYLNFAVKYTGLIFLNLMTCFYFHLLDHIGK